MLLPLLREKLCRDLVEIVINTCPLKVDNLFLCLLDQRVSLDKMSPRSLTTITLRIPGDE